MSKSTHDLHRDFLTSDIVYPKANKIMFWSYNFIFAYGVNQIGGKRVNQTVNSFIWTKLAFFYPELCKSDDKNNLSKCGGSPYSSITFLSVIGHVLLLILLQWSMIPDLILAATFFIHVSVSLNELKTSSSKSDRNTNSWHFLCGWK